MEAILPAELCNLTLEQIYQATLQPEQYPLDEVLLLESMNIARSIHFTAEYNLIYSYFFFCVSCATIAVRCLVWNNIYKRGMIELQIYPLNVYMYIYTKCTLFNMLYIADELSSNNTTSSYSKSAYFVGSALCPNCNFTKYTKFCSVEHGSR